MTTPNLNKRLLRPGLNKSQKSTGFVKGILICMCLLVVATYIGSETPTVPPSKTARRDTKQVSSEDIVKFKQSNALWRLSNEASFERTLKSCIPMEDKKCKVYIPERTTAQRIAILSPPGETADAIASWVERIIQTSFHGDVVLVKSSHVPPYGYGKTHGWTKIIRLVATPLLWGVADVLQHFEPGHDSNVLDFQMAFRQIVRWHCRLSHVAAHTAELTLTYDTVNLFPESTAQKILSFVSGIESQIGQVPSMGSPGMLLTPHASAQSFWTRSEQTLGVNLTQVLDQVLAEEMQLSKNLSAWPCQPFWNTPETMSSITTKLAQALSPDCVAELVKCFVNLDNCEARGDAICKDR